MGEKSTYSCNLEAESDASVDWPPTRWTEEIPRIPWMDVVRCYQLWSILRGKHLFNKRIPPADDYGDHDHSTLSS